MPENGGRNVVSLENLFNHCLTVIVLEVEKKNHYMQPKTIIFVPIRTGLKWPRALCNEFTQRRQASCPTIYEKLSERKRDSWCSTLVRTDYASPLASTSTEDTASAIEKRRFEPIYVQYDI